MIAVLGLVAVAIGFIPLRQREPVFQGRPLMAWIGDLDTNSGEKRDRAKEVLRHIGSNAVPTLIDLMRRKDPALKRVLAEWINKQRIIKWRVRTAIDWKLRARAACQVIGPAAIPQLTEFLNDGESANEAAQLLHAVVKQAPAAVLVLGNALTNRDSQVRFAAARTLAGIQADARTAINVGAMWTDARAAVPALLKAVNDPDTAVRLAVHGALKQIDLEAATKAGVK